MEEVKLSLHPASAGVSLIGKRFVCRRCTADCCSNENIVQFEAVIL
jgi:hypothetical protein|tara:strand:- start:838 stop:975 length:138 start_codon:yes stop_codon:yes gene_type:complete